jgi:signal transduction histidine kinase
LKYSGESKENLDILLLYRHISVAVLTIVFIITWRNNITYSKIFVMLGMLVSSTLGALLYRQNYSVNNYIVIVAVILESLAYNIFIFLSGGLSSPYLWYYINIFIIITALKPFGRYSVIISVLLMLLMLVNVIVQRRIGLTDTRDFTTYSDINTGIAFIVVCCGFYFLLENNNKLLKNKSELHELNIGLNEAKKQSDCALECTMNVYDALNLFSMSNPQKVLDELNLMLYRTIAKKGCAIFEINSSNNIGAFSYENIDEEQISQIADFVLKTLKLKNQSMPSNVNFDHKIYDIKYIRNDSNILLALIFMLRGETPTEACICEKENVFYLHLVETIIHELDMQSMMEAYIVSEEQHRIASQIHDIVIQKLFYAVCSISALGRRIDNLTAEEVKMDLNELAKSIESIMKTLREAIYGIEWDVENENKFENKLSTYINEVRDINDMDIIFKFDEDISILSSSKKTSLYRIICEAVNNSVRHSKATEIDVSITADEEFVTAVIKDNGKGFDKNNIPEGRQGIKNMHIVTVILKGTLIINSKETTGTEIICKIPV